LTLTYQLSNAAHPKGAFNRSGLDSLSKPVR
jgi:hypothetical protein